MGLRFDPVGGGQFKQAVQQIIEAESQPIKNIEKRKGKEEARLKLFNEFKGKFSGIEKSLLELSSFRKFRELKVDLGDGANLISVTLDKEKADPGQYTLEVIDLAARTSVISNGFENPDENVLGLGFITLNLENGNSTEIYVEDRNSSLNGIAATINRQPGSPVRAAVIKDSSDTSTPWKLILTAKKDGALNQIDIPEFYFMDGSTDFYIDDDREARNAELAIDGFPVELESNDVSDFLPGVNLHLKQARPDQPFILNISEDYQKMAGKVKALIDNINQILQFIVKQNTIDKDSDTSTTFAGDGSLQTLEYRIRNVIHQGFSADVPDSEEPATLFLHQIGIEFDKTGQLTFKEERFNKELESHLEAVGEAITGPVGFVYQLRALLEGYTRSGNGFLNAKEKGIKSRIEAIDNQIEQKTRLLDRRKQDLTAQFSRLEGTLANLQRQQQYLSATLPGAGGGSVVSQLLG